MSICLSISSSLPQRWRTLLQSEPFVELRCDLMGITPSELREILPLAQKAIVTCHTSNTKLAEEIYLVAIERGAWAVDFALSMPLELRQRLTREAQKRGVRVIFSHHYTNTPPFEELEATAQKMYAEGCGIAKIITTASTTAEALIPLRLLNRFSKGSIVAFAMGEAGRFSRRLSLLTGAPYTYAAPSEEEHTALGQPTAEWLRGSFKCNHSLKTQTIPHTITPLASKSEAQRAIILAILCRGVTTIENYTPCGDTLAAERVAEALGATISHPTSTTLVIVGSGIEGVRKALHHAPTLSVGESALLARLTIPIISLLCGSNGVALQGAGSLCRRDLSRDIEIINTQGALCTSTEGRLPIAIQSPLTPPSTMVIDGSGSSQSISGWMIVLGSIGGTHTLEVTNPTSRPYIALTAQMMEQFGARVEVVATHNKITINIDSNGYIPTALTLNADWSGGAYFAVAYAIAQSGWRVKDDYSLRATIGTNQADEVVLHTLRSVGAKMEIGDGKVRFLPSEKLRAFSFDATDSPDLIPTLAVLALYCEGSSRIGGLHRLANKESNRTEAIVENLWALGARVSIEGDELVIVGGHKLHPAPLRSHNDHRIVMSMAVAALFMDSSPTIECVESVAKSYPHFFEQLKG